MSDASLNITKLEILCQETKKAFLNVLIFVLCLCIKQIFLLLPISNTKFGFTAKKVQINQL